jgi:glyoxylase-like metal-dependent hydrolase (beta-lactamase superfamily II)
MKRALRWVGVVVLVLAALVASAWYSAFGGNSAIVDGQTLAPGATVVKDGFVSVAILDVGPGKVALIDAGNDPAAKSTLAALTARGMNADSVVAIFLTHGHGDHTAGCKAFPRADVVALATEVGVIGEAAKVTRPLQDGAVVELGELRVEAFAVPGHTVGSAAYLARGVLFFGDSAGASSKGEVMKAVRLFSKDSSQNVASLKALAARLAPRAAEVKELAFAHTGPLVGFEPLRTFASRD